MIEERKPFEKRQKPAMSMSYIIRLTLTAVLLFAVAYPLATNMPLGDLAAGWAICLMFLPFFIYDVITDRK